MLGLTRRDKQRSEWIRERTEVDDMIDKIDVMIWSWAGHLGRIENDRWAKKVQSRHLDQKI